MSRLIRIALADDQLLFRKGLASLLNTFQGTELLYEAANGQMLLDQMEQHPFKPDIVMLDLNMPVMNGMETTQKIRELYPGTRIIVLSVYNEEKFVTRMLELGINGYLFKESEPAEVEAAIHAVMEKGFYMNRQVGGVTPRVQDDDAELTQKETEVLSLICRQHTLPEIAQKLSITLRTAEGHHRNLIRKTGSRNIAGLVIYAIRNNLAGAGF